MAKQMTGAEMVVEALKDQGVEMVFGYPGGAVLPIYDAMFHQNKVRHMLVRHEQGAAHAAEGYARSTGKVGVLLVTSGPGATNAITGLTDALMRFDPARLHHRAGADASHRLGRVPGMRHDRHHAQLHQAQLSRAPHRGSAAHPARGVLRRLARASRPGRHRHPEGRAVRHRRLFLPEGTSSTRPIGRSSRATSERINHAIEMMAKAKKPIFYTGGGVDQFRAERLDAAARTRAPDRLPDHFDADGPRRLSRPPTSNGSACSACTARSKPTTPCTIAI